MADKKTFTIHIDGVEKSIDSITTLREELNKAANSSGIADLEHNLKTLTEAYKSLSRAEQDSEIGTKLLQEIELYESQIQSATRAMREQHAEVEKSLALRETEEGSVEQLKLLIKQLTADYEELSEKERGVSGSDLLYRIQLLQEKLSGLETTNKSHLATLGSLGEHLQTISNGFDNSKSAISSFSGILSSSSDVLKLFGIQSRSLTDTVEKLGAITKTLSTLQAFHTQLVEKDSIVMKAAAVAKKLYTAATQGSSLALKGFKAALVSTGIGAFIILLGYLITHFDDIKKEIGNAVGGMDKFDAIMREVEPVVASVGNALIQFLLMPVKQIINAVSGLINVIEIFKEKGTDGFKDAFKEISDTAKKSTQIAADGLKFSQNYDIGLKNSRIKAAKEATQSILKMNSDLQSNYIKNMEAQKGANWKYTKEGISAHESYFDACLAMYEKDSEDYIKIQRDKWAFQNDVAERKKPAKRSGANKEPDDYLKDLKNVQKETNALLIETEEKQIEHLKNLAAITTGEDAARFIKEAAKKELHIQSQKHQQEKELLFEHQKEMEEKQKGDENRLAEIKETFGLKLAALNDKQSKERMELTRNQSKELIEIEDKTNAASLQKQIDNYDKLIAAQDDYYKTKKEDAEKANKDIVKRNGLGLIDVGETRKSYEEAKKQDKEYLTSLTMAHLAKSTLFNQELEAAKGNSEKTKDINTKRLAENDKYLKESTSIEKRIEENTKKSGEVQKEYFKELHAKMTEVWGKINEGLTAAFGVANSIMKQQMEEAKAKLKEVTKQYDAIVEKRKESQDKLKSLEEEASTASGGRAIVVQEQIARQMAANEELAIQEKDLAKQKEKLEKDIAKKEKQTKKTELGQKLVEGIANTALAVTKALAAGPFIGQIMAGLAAAAGAVQTAIIARQLSKLEDGGLLKGKRHSQGGMRIEGSNIEVEGDEFVVNRISTRKNLGLIDYINKQRRELSPADLTTYFTRNGQGNAVQQHTIKHMYEQGGQLTNLEVIDSATAPDSNKILEAISRINFQPVVSVVDITNTQNTITQVKDIVGI